MDLDRLRKNLAEVRERIQAACRRAGRDPGQVTLVVVTKSAPPEVIPALAELGVTEMGENRALEGLSRLGSLKGVRRHMIGHLQTNKVRKVLEWADVIHSVDRPSLLAELGRHNTRPPVFVQVNISGEATKGGFPPGLAPQAVREAARTHEVLGLMTMAPRGGDPRACFRSLRELSGRCGVGGLSMGMTEDFEAAVEEGATIVRIGSAIFEGVLL
ncbi:MAG TPA: YggS family pyridoxal phosphate-dependent enzyme [Planctomycetota bacterium]|nr:YggS family pyridoxal phosphate-dependent enzyme [Planctomycetota bacterium]